MAARSPLPVWLYGRHVADIVDAGFGDTAVRYTPDAVARPNESRLSVSMPPRIEVYPTAGPGGRWVRSLLPEGRALDWVVEHYAIPAEDRYGLIAALGADVAGAVQILDPDLNPDSNAGSYERLDMNQVTALVNRVHDAPLGLDPTHRVRLSLAGMQDKVLLHRDADGWMQPVNGAASTLILKPEPQDRPDRMRFDGLATNEAYCATLARLVGIDAAPVTVEWFGGLAALVVERYDRHVAGNGTIERIHQEDFLGALGLDPLIKYEVSQSQRMPAIGGWGAPTFTGRTGPDLVTLASVVSSQLGAGFLVGFAERVVFNIVIGNADAHARNYSLLLEPDGLVRFAPMYDMIATMLYPQLDADAAQRVNGVDDLDAITLSDLIAEAVRWGVPPRLAAARIKRTIERIATAAATAVDHCVELGGQRDVAEQVADLVAIRAGRLAK